MGFFTLPLAALLLATVAAAAAVSGGEESSSFTTTTPGGYFVEVKHLPGWPNGTALPAKTFSGMLNITETAPQGAEMLMHYMLFESEHDPINDPIIVWWNGGPGATSMWGIFVENGPMMLNDESYVSGRFAKTGVPDLIRNPYSWTKFATVISFANPPPCGFSFCTPPGPPGNGYACGTWNDTRVAKTDAEGLRIVFEEHFPHLLHGTRDVFFIGESYAGVYISTTTKEVVMNPKYKKIAAHLAGVALGDACLGTKVICGGARGPYDELLFLYGHGQFPTEMWDTLTKDKCTVPMLRRGPLSSTCQQYVNFVMNAVGEYYGYNLYDNCPDNFFAIRRRRSTARTFATQERKKKLPTVAGGAATTTVAPQVDIAFNGYWCPGNAFNIYFNVSEVRTALAVPQDSAFFMADNGNGMNYVFNEENVLPFLAALIKAQPLPNGTMYHPELGQINTKKRVRLMSYNGDSDPSVEMFATQDIWYGFAKNQSLTKSQEWRTWSTGSNVAGGYYVQWMDAHLTYLTVRGSGHMIPEFKPLAAMVFIEHWVNNKTFPHH